tara:strand:+ start:707 stop:1351 length:645 start_codon:yes stop_codon:yes gene_type:complete
MAKQTVNIGTVANDGTGDNLRAAYDKLNDNNDELYALLGNGTNLSITGDVSVSAGAVTIANDAVEQAMIADDAVGADQLASNAVVTASIVDDNVTFDKLENRFTASQLITNTSGATSVDWSAATVFKMNADCTGAKEFDFTNYKVGQVITIHGLKGAYTITLDSDAATSETFNKLGGNDYDGSTFNALMVECIDDSANAIFNYSILTYTADTTP